MQTRWPNHEALAFAGTAQSMTGTLVSTCAGWTAHDVLAHVVAGGAEISRLVGAHLAGEPTSITTSFDEREPAFRALAYDDLVAFVSAGGLFDQLETMAANETTLEFTGWEMTADTLALHVRSELALHRWDLTGSDPTSLELLSQPELTTHAARALHHFGVLNERAKARTDRAGIEELDARIRVEGQPDVVITVSNGTTDVSLAEPNNSQAVTTDAAARLLMLWGRRPSATHHITSNLDNATLRGLDAWLY